MPRITVVAFVVAILAALACGPAPAPAPPVDTGGQPKHGGRLTVWVTQDPTTWDNAVSGTSSVSDRWRARSYEGLLRFKAAPGHPFTAHTPEPSLAERWEVSPDAKTFTYHLRKGVKWQDIPPVNGREFTSADVKFSWDYYSRSGEFKDWRDRKLKPSLFSYWFEGVESIEAPEKYTIVVKFKDSFAPFLNYSAHSKNAMFAREVFDKEGSFENTLIGTGAFMLDTAASQKGTRWVMKKNPNYWDTGKPYLDELFGVVLPEAATAFAAFQTKQLDLLGESGYDLSPEDNKQIMAMVPTAVSQKDQDGSPQNMYINVRKAPWNNELVRRALNRAIDREELIKVMTAGEGPMAIAGAFPEHFTQDEIKKVQPYDPEEAKRLLAQAGYPNGFDIEFLASQSYGQVYLTMAQLLQAQLKKVGMNMSIKTLDHPSYLQQTRGTTPFDIAIRGKSVQGDVDSYLFQVFHPSSEGNYGGVNDPELTKLVEEQRKVGDPEKRREVVRQAVKYISDKSLGLATFYEVEYTVWHPHVKNFARNFGVDGWPITNVWIDK